jgi:hypothetical protein
MLKKNLSLTLMLGSMACATSANGALLVTEFMPDPSGTDAEREWMEIYNSGTTTLNLDGYKVGDEESSTGLTEGMFQFPTGTEIAPGGVIVIANTATGFKELYGKNPTFEFNNAQTLEGDSDISVPDMIKYTAWSSGPFSVSNTNDQVVILDPDDNVIDRAEHGNTNSDPSKVWPVLGANQSYERVPANVDTNSPSDFVVRTSGNATPGQVTLAVPEPGSIALLSVGAMALLGRRRRNAGGAR